jgi:dephospho-CoA kinase
VHIIVTDISEEDTLLHEQWCQRYEILKIEQKQAIRKWRTLKNKINQESSTNSQSVELNLRSKVGYQKDSVENKQKVEEWKVIYLTVYPYDKENL